MQTFVMPVYHAPDFGAPGLKDAPDAAVAPCEADGIAPEYFHSTSMYPEYFRLGGEWRLAEESRMDCCVVLREDGRLDVVEQRNLRAGDRVILGRSEDGSEGIFLHADGFSMPDGASGDQFAFRAGRSRETAYSRDYDKLYALLRYEKEHGGKVVFVMGPACAFDHDSRRAVQALIENGYVQGLLAGNALATHDLEAGSLGTALGQDVYTQVSRKNGHYNHLDVLNRARRLGGIPQYIREYGVKDGIMYALVKTGVPFVLTGSIRDDGPLPEVYADCYRGQAAMRGIIRDATTVICLATQLHTIATGNMTPSFRVVNGTLRPVYLYAVDISEFVVNKLRDRGSLSSVSVVTNVQDFVVNLQKGILGGE